MLPEFEVADVVDSLYDEAFRVRIPVHHQRKLKALQFCRTTALGGRFDACYQCGHLRYNICRHRNYTKCQGFQKEMWMIQRQEELLPASYFYGVFTLPKELNGLCLRNPRFYFFDAAWHVLDSFGNDTKWLGVCPQRQ